MRYDYECSDCEHQFVVTCSWSDHQPTQVCPECGGPAPQFFGYSNPQVCVKGNTKDFKLDATCVPLGWDKGNTDVDAQERAYAKKINEERKLAQANDKAAIKNGIRKIGSVPRELVRARQKQFGKDYWQSDIKAKLKEEGLYYHKD